MIDDRFDELLQEVAREYNAPPDTPREPMWARIEAIRRERAERRRQLRILYSPWARWGLGLAAALLIGIGIGRLTIRQAPQPESLAVTTETGALAARGGAALKPGPRLQLAYRLVTTEHLSRAEAFLTSFRADPRAGAADVRFWSDAGELLSSTRLLLDSPAATDGRFRALLEELELVLVQIAQLSYERGEGELELVTDGIDSRGVLAKLRASIPAGPVFAIEGA